jgi:hypothetical protein
LEVLVLDNYSGLFSNLSLITIVNDNKEALSFSLALMAATSFSFSFKKKKI